MIVSHNHLLIVHYDIILIILMIRYRSIKSGSTCTSRDIYKSAKHALKDCEECSSYYIGES